jgi:predicted nucleic-acid-binding protein
MKRSEENLSENLPDTNVIIRYLVKDNLNLYEEAYHFFEKVKTGEVNALILESVIAECIYVLTKIYKVPKERAADSLIGILRYKGIANSDREELIEALNVFARQNIDIVDCILCAKAKSISASIFSFDMDLHKIVSRKER